MTKTARLLKVATSYVGVAERPAGANDDGGGPITRWITRWGLQRLPARDKPWCAMYVDGVLAEAEVDDAGIGHPATAEMCRRARALGAVVPLAQARPGDVVVWCGVHTGLILERLGPALFRTVEGNTDDAVRYRVRDLSSATIIRIPELAREAAWRPRTYWLEDPWAIGRQRLLGPWRGAWGLRRARAVAGRRPPAEHARVKQVRPGRFGVLIGPLRYRGPWLDEADRDAARVTLERSLGRRLRPFSRPAPANPAPGSATADTGDRTT